MKGIEYNFSVAIFKLSYLALIKRDLSHICIYY